MAEPVALAPFAAGLTNQKLALIGLALHAREQGRSAALAPLTDFVPGSVVQDCLPFETVFHRDHFAAAMEEFGVRVAAGRGEPIDGGMLLGRGGEAVALARRTRDDDAFRSLCKLLAGMVPAPPIADTADQACAWLAARGVRWGCQLRIERDWLHWTELHRADDRVDPQEALYVDYRTALAKLAAATDGEASVVYVTCNEADLPVPRAEIVDHARVAHGLDLVFRSMIPLDVSAGPLRGAALDFAIVSALPHFVGHTRSTFFGALAMVAHGRGRSAEFWFYNNRGSLPKRRQDHGAFVRPWAAAHL